MEDKINDFIFASAMIEWKGLMAAVLQLTEVNCN